jgi:hypothetical protein
LSIFFLSFHTLTPSFPYIVLFSHFNYIFLFYRLLLSSFSFDFFYFRVFVVQLICFSFVIRWLKYLLFVLFKNDNSAYRLWGPPAYSMGTGGAFTRGKRPGREADHPPPSSGITPLLLHCLHAAHWDDSTLSLGFFVFVLFPFILCTSFVFASLVLISFSCISLSSISCAFIFLFNHILSAYFPPPPPFLFFLASFLVLCSFVFMYCIFPLWLGIAL